MSRTRSPWRARCSSRAAPEASTQVTSLKCGSSRSVKSPLKLPSSRTFPGRKNGRNDRIMSGCMTSKSKPYTYLWSLVSRISVSESRSAVIVSSQVEGQGRRASVRGSGVAVGEAELLVEPPGGPVGGRHLERERRRPRPPGAVDAVGDERRGGAVSAQLGDHADVADERLGCPGGEVDRDESHELAPVPRLEAGRPLGEFRGVVPEVEPRAQWRREVRVAARQMREDVVGRGGVAAVLQRAHRSRIAAPKPCRPKALPL